MAARGGAFEKIAGTGAQEEATVTILVHKNLHSGVTYFLQFSS
jgi:hypothetical protein